MRKLACAAATLMIHNGVASAAPKVGIAFDEQCVSCTAVAIPGTPLRAFVILSGWSQGSHCVGCGLAGIDFKIEGIPADWSASYVMSPMASFASDPLFAGGAQIQFDPPLASVPECFVLYTIDLVPSTTSTNRITVVEHPVHNCRQLGGPQGPSWTECPVDQPALLCGGECGPGGSARLNGIVCQLTALYSAPWHDVKRLYR